MRRFLTEPLLHFGVLGVLLFALYGWVHRGKVQNRESIVVDQKRLDAIASEFEGAWQRPPTAKELDSLVENWIRDEVFYREGLAAGLERDDLVVKRRVVQKMTFLTEGMASDVPSDAQVEAYFKAHADEYRTEPRYTFRQIYFDATKHADLDALVATTRATLDKDPSASGALGDPTLLPGALSDAALTEIARAFGEQFAEGLEKLEPGRWQGPISSAYGAHFVRIELRVVGGVPPLAQVRAAVERDAATEHVKAAVESFYRASRGHYQVRIDARSPSSASSVAGRPSKPGDGT